MTLQPCILNELSVCCRCNYFASISVQQLQVWLTYNENLTNNHNKVDIQPAIRVVNDHSFLYARLCISTYCESHIQLLGECNSEVCVDPCVDYHSELSWL